MSDFAPFVASVLRDDVVHEMVNENSQLRDENARLRAEVEMLRTPTAKLISNDGTVVLSGTYERSSCFDLHHAVCYLDSFDRGPVTLSQLSQCTLSVSGIHHGEVTRSDIPSPVLFYEVNISSPFPEIHLEALDFELKLCLQIDRGAFLSFVGIPVDTEDRITMDADFDVDAWSQLFQTQDFSGLK